MNSVSHIDVPSPPSLPSTLKNQCEKYPWVRINETKTSWLGVHMMIYISVPHRAGEGERSEDAE